MDRIISADPSAKMNPQWQSIMRPIFIGDTELLENVQCNLEGRITFRLNGNKIVYDFQRAGGVEYRLARKGDWIHVQRRVGDLLAIRKSAEKGPQL